jgi:hypothetical protein
MKYIVTLIVIGLLGYGGFLWWKKQQPVFVPSLVNHVIETDTYVMENNIPSAAEASYPELYTYVTQQMKDFEAQYGQDEDLKQIQTAPYELQIDTKIATSTQTISFIVSMYQYTGGAHGNTTIQTFTYDKLGKYITDKDVFASPDWKSQVSPYIQQYLSEHIGKYSTSEQIQGGTNPTKDNLNVWYLTDDAVVFIFEQYTVGPYVLGIQEVSVPKQEITGLLQKTFK